MGSLKEMWMNVATVLSSVVGALIVLVIGLIVASGISAVVERLIKMVKIDSVLEKLGIGEYVDRAGLKLNSGRFIGRIVYWFFVIVFLLAASDIMKFYTLSSFLEQVLLYIPNVVVAALIMLAAIVVGHFLRHLVSASVKSARLHASSFLGALTFWAIIIFGFLASLSQLGVAVSIINSLVTGFIAMVALAGGIAFGLGGRDLAQDILEKLEGHVREE